MRPNTQWHEVRIVRPSTALATNKSAERRIGCLGATGQPACDRDTALQSDLYGSLSGRVGHAHLLIGDRTAGIVPSAVPSRSRGIKVVRSRCQLHALATFPLAIVRVDHT